MDVAPWCYKWDGYWMRWDVSSGANKRIFLNICFIIYVHLKEILCEIPRTIVCRKSLVPLNPKMQLPDLLQTALC